jgi:hypothetical protein
LQNYDFQPEKFMEGGILMGNITRGSFCVLSLFRNPVIWLQILSAKEIESCACPNFGLEIIAGTLLTHPGLSFNLKACASINGGEAADSATLKRLLLAGKKQGISISNIFNTYGMAESLVFM